MTSISKASTDEEIGEFWDTHDFADFDTCAPEVELEILPGLLQDEDGESTMTDQEFKHLRRGDMPPPSREGRGSRQARRERATEQRKNLQGRRAYQGLPSHARPLICENCGRDGARVRRVSRSYGKEKDLLLMDNVPVVTCPHCGASYIKAATMDELEQIKARHGADL